jgi:hypothetical protein
MIRSNLLQPIEETSFELSLGGPLGAPPRRKRISRKVSEVTINHFANILAYIRVKKEEGRRSLSTAVPALEGGFQTSGGRWGDIMV